MKTYKQYLKENDNDYRGHHTAPDKDTGSPLYDVTLNDTYSDEIYGINGKQYYGDRQSFDNETFYILNGVHNKPNAKVKIYRAVPKIISNKDQIKEYLQHKKYILKTGKVPKEVTKWNNSSDYYTHISNELEKLEKLSNTVQEKVTINVGDWVAVSKQYATNHGKTALNNKYRIISKTVPAKHVYTNGDSINEWGYDPT